MKKKIKILQVVAELGSGGVESMLYNYYVNMDLSVVEFDFIVFGNEVGLFEEKFGVLGSQIYHIPARKDGLINNLKLLFEILKNNQIKYDIIHVHRDTIAGIVLIISKLAGYKIRISHAHNAIPNMTKKQKNLKKINSIFINKFATDYFACGNKAGKWLYGKKVHFKGKIKVINNAIDVKKYLYNDLLRDEVRKSLGIENKFVLGNIGRFSAQKNQDFLIDIFYNLHKFDNESVLLLVGDGNNIDIIKEKVNSVNLQDSVYFLGVRNDIPNLMQAMDVFVLPSIFEGLPVVMVEAQAASLPCIVSTNITTEVKVLDCVEYVKIGEDTSEWIKTINKYRNFKRIDVYDKLKNGNFNIIDEAIRLQSYYEKLVNKNIER